MPLMRQILTLAVVLALSCGHFAVAAEIEVLTAEERKSLRAYEAGPLTKDDFHTEPPEMRVVGGIVLRSNVFTDVRYRYRGEGRAKGKNVEVKLTAIRVVAVVDRSKSWNADPTDAALLDHEQGHFDISAIAAARTQNHFDKLIAGEGLRAEGKDEKAAGAAMDQKVAEVFGELLRPWREEQVDYDRATVHGADQRQQTAHRRQQKEMLEVLRREAEKREAIKQ